jgi:anti-sigma regulatory factor (Ser/Thr protein kinase)
LAPGGYDGGVPIDDQRADSGAFRLALTATPDCLARVRAELGAWLQGTGVDDQQASDIVLVVNEAASNSVEHAYRDTQPGVLQIDAERRGTEICIQIVDFGSWKTVDPAPRTRGRGLPMMRAVSDHIDVDSTAAGTTVEMRFVLTDHVDHAGASVD